MSRPLPRASFFGIALGITLVDQETKRLIVADIPIGHSVVVVPQLLQFTRTINTGAAFGVMPLATTFLAAVAVVAALAIAVYALKPTTVLSLQTGTGLALALGGAVGNVIDRIHLGYVVDFLDIPIQIHGRQWPVFNVADSAICVGVVLLAIRLSRSDDKSQPEQLITPEPEPSLRSSE